MRWHRRNTQDTQQPTTSYASAENRVPHRRQKIHSPHPVISEFTASDELFFVRANQDQLNTHDSPRLYAGGSPSAHSNQQQRNGASTASVIVFAFALSGILLVFLLFYFLAKVCSPASEEELKDQSESMANGTMKRATPRKMASGVQESPRHVLYPRRIYELQAEEGCYSSLPSMKTPESSGDDVVVLKKSSSPSTKKRNFKQLVRKLTTSSVPLPEDFVYTPSNSPGNSPRFSTCSES